MTKTKVLTEKDAATVARASRITSPGGMIGEGEPAIVLEAARIIAASRNGDTLTAEEERIREAAFNMYGEYALKPRKPPPPTFLDSELEQREQLRDDAAAAWERKCEQTADVVYKIGLLTGDAMVSLAGGKVIMPTGCPYGTPPRRTDPLQLRELYRQAEEAVREEREEHEAFGRAQSAFAEVGMAVQRLRAIAAVE